jgi:hypothetical protein
MCRSGSSGWSDASTTIPTSDRERHPGSTLRRLGIRVGAAGVILCLATVALLTDYRVSRNRLEPDRADNRVVTAVRAAGDGAGPVLGVPIMAQAVTWNSSST